MLAFVFISGKMGLQFMDKMHATRVFNNRTASIKRT